MTAREGLLACVPFDVREVPMDELPFAGRQQTRVDRQWDRMLHVGSDAWSDVGIDFRSDVRGTSARIIVADSWRRSLLAAVPPDLQRAPVVLDADTLLVAREHADWLPLAERALRDLGGSLADDHVVSLFDAEAHMLGVTGSAAVVEQLAASNFRPGALWSEHAVGTNGPGTALALRRPVHIIGAEHFCHSWHDWHCAAVPLADTVTGDVLGIIDISGFRSDASPQALALAKAIVSRVQVAMAQREAHRHAALLRRFTQLVTTYRHDDAVVVDARGMVLQTTPSVSSAVRPGMVVRDDAWRPAEGTPVLLAFHDDITIAAISHPVYDGGVIIGACLLLDGSRGIGRNRQTVPADDSVRTGARTGGRPIRDGFSAVHRANHGCADRRTISASHVSPTRYTFADIIGSHDCMASARRIAEQAARSGLPVLIHGGPGTGKGVFAQAIHAASDRCGGPFVEVRCAAVPHELAAADLFGYVDDAFTGARLRGSDGRFAAADGGTIFLEEVEALSLPVQASLVRVLQEGAVTPVGGSTKHPIDVRVIAAMTRHVNDAVESGALKGDLFERLNLMSVVLPRLRDRGTDVQALALHFLAESAIEVGRPALTFAPAVLEALARQEWPGNVRELRNTVRRMASMCVGTCITIGQLPTELL